MMEFSSDDEQLFGAPSSEGELFQLQEAQSPPPIPMPFGDAHQLQRTHAQQGVRIEVLTHPTSEVRTRTPGDKRLFASSVQLHGEWRGRVATVVAELLFSPDRLHAQYDVAPVKLLGGSLQCAPDADGICHFTQLSLWEPSAKHDEREFSLRFMPLDANGVPVVPLEQAAVSNSFYAFSHARVLKRRRDVFLRALNKTTGCSLNGGDRMFVVGRGFIDGPTLSVVVQSAGGETRANQLEFWSECVIFFTLPPIPLGMQLGSTVDRVPATLFVSNDGRSMSNPLEFEYSEIAAGQEGISSAAIMPTIRARF